eukprot:scaffold54505_cov20-Tisochrysis_lutea.AAC.1
MDPVGEIIDQVGGLRGRVQSRQGGRGESGGRADTLLPGCLPSLLRHGELEHDPLAAAWGGAWGGEPPKLCQQGELKQVGLGVVAGSVIAAPDAWTSRREAPPSWNQRVGCERGVAVLL